jgi:lisH domain-containing protein FOPNL
MRTTPTQDERKPDPPREVFLINELIRDYLEFQGYKHTLSVFLPGQCPQSERTLVRWPH